MEIEDWSAPPTEFPRFKFAAAPRYFQLKTFSDKLSEGFHAKNFATCCDEATKLRLAGDYCENRRSVTLVLRARSLHITIHDCGEDAKSKFGECVLCHRSVDDGNIQDRSRD